MRVFFYTLGCKSNQYETGRLREKFFALGFAPADKAAEAAVIVINTCCVTHSAERKSRNILRRFQKIYPRAKIFVCGCYANIADLASIIPGVSPIKQEQKLKPQEWGLPGFSRAASGRNYRVREFLKIQEGCDRFCGYCIVPYARPQIYSEPPEKILATAENLLRRGVQEIVLTGINLGLYNYTGQTLAAILRQLARIKIPRLRLSSLEPDLLTDQLLETLAENPGIARHLHIPLQSGSDTILKAMRRRYTAADYRRLIRRARKMLGEDSGLTTDIIAGFPGETEKTFTETLEFIREIGFSDLHIFPYSRRPRTAAARLPISCPVPLVKQFVSRLENLRQGLKQDFLKKHLFRPLAVLVENNRGAGFSSEYIQVKLQDKSSAGKFYRVQATAIQDDFILAKSAPE